MKRTTLFLLLTCTLSAVTAAQTQFSVQKTNGHFQVSLMAQNDQLLYSEPSGLWKIATEWSKRWPDEWISIQADSLELINGYSILHGSASVQNGQLKMRDSYIEQDQRIKCTRRWEWTGADTLRKVTLSILFRSPETNNRVLIPGAIYYGNPAGARSGRTPVLKGTPGEFAIFEEHRLPMPFVSREWGQGELCKAVAIHSLPSPVPFGNKEDQWWSMGVSLEQDYSELGIYSGPVGFNEERSVIKAFQGNNMMESYDEAWMNIPPGTIIEKTFYIQSENNTAQGSGFQHAVETSLEIFHPWDVSNLPDYDQILNSKINFADSRYQEGDDYAGYRKYPDRPFFVLGWCGQAMAPGYALQVLSKKYPQARRPENIQKSLDFLSSSPFYESGFYTWYNIEKNEWFMSHTPEWLSQGQAMLNMANAIQAADSSYDTGKWKDFLHNAAGFHARRMLSSDWKPESTNEGFFIAPLVLSYRIFKDELFLKAAEKAAAYYANLYLQMEEVYWGGTLDASCEDKEGAFAALQGFIELYDLTGEDKYLVWARHAGDVCLTYTVVWDIPLPPGRLTDHSFKTRGWTAVSVQNMHIDVYGVLIAPYIYRLGQAVGNPNYLKTAELMFRSCGQLIDPYGSQGEQPYQTNYIQTDWQDKPLHERRGNYVETWTVFWITAHFLNAGAMFMELGVL